MNSGRRPLGDLFTSLGTEEMKMRSMGIAALFCVGALLVTSQQADAQELQRAIELAQETNKPLIVVRSSES